jgi:hypothetical protein
VGGREFVNLLPTGLFSACLRHSVRSGSFADPGFVRRSGGFVRRFSGSLAGSFAGSEAENAHAMRHNERLWRT